MRIADRVFEWVGRGAQALGARRWTGHACSTPMVGRLVVSTVLGAVGGAMALWFVVSLFSGDRELSGSIFKGAMLVLGVALWAVTFRRSGPRP